MLQHTPALHRPRFGRPLQHEQGHDFSVLVVGVERELTLQVRNLLQDAGLEAARVIGVPALEPALELLAGERPGIIFLGVGLPELGNLNALVRLQAAAPGVPVVPLPVITHEATAQAPWWPFRARRAIDRHEVVGLLQQLALMDEGAREMFYLATHDRLTDLANRWLLEERLTHAIARSRRNQTMGALLFIDLDDFKAINDRHGHETGDRMLKIVAERLLHAVRASDTVARWGGDEFAVILEGIGDRDQAHAKSCELIQRLAEPAEAVGALRASVGVALFPDDGQDVTTLLGQADRRMYRTKGRRVLWSVFRRG